MNGQYAHNIDAKGRLFIPTKLRDELGGTLHVTVGQATACPFSPTRAGPTSTPASRARALPGSRVCA